MKGTRYAQENVRFRERSGRITLGFWGCISSHVSGPLVRITPHIYVHVLSNVMMLYMAKTFSGISYVNFIRLRTLNYSVKSPNLNVIENV
ncbi:hypothetical protein ALC60_08458 [Trachymyrmex zeteki]|uniref:Uncharacterized protein n=1 Tax=Mycetomoellerius zeteki TaxID=64791 RepID=A0A151WX29_9HYME|nr:hypothetical protein ALC60_08458 [Trachymyrmex zeteki]